MRRILEVVAAAYGSFARTRHRLITNDHKSYIIEGIYVR